MFFSRLKKSLEWAVVLVLLTTSLPLYAQTGQLTGKCTDEKGNPLVGYILLIDRQEIKGIYKTKTDKKGSYVYIGLPVGPYNITLQSPTGQTVYALGGVRVAMGDPTEQNFDMAKERAIAGKQQEEMLKANPELQKKVEEQAKETKEYTSLKEIFDQGVVLYNGKQYPEAAAMFEKALPLAKEKNQAAVLARLADSYGKAQQYDKAMEYYPKAIAASPTDAALHNNLGDIYARMGKLTEAQQEFQKAADMNPAGAAQYYFNLGAIMYNIGKMDEAAAAFKKATEVDPNHADAYYWEGLALMGKASMSADGKVTAPPGTVEALESYLRLQPNGKNVAEAQAMLQMIQGKIDTQYKAAPKKKKN
jgi:tetratricopeptide (TPR) repeat protein